MELNVLDARTKRQRQINHLASCCEKLGACCRFIYNINDNTICGKTLKNWGSHLLFYLMIFVFTFFITIGLSYIVLYVFLNGDRPELNKLNALMHENKMGISAQPVTVESENIIIGNRKYKQFYNEIINKKFKDYIKINNLLYDDCLKNKSNVKNCKFDFTTLGPCGKEPYGYDDENTKPCIYIRLNRIVDWIPVPYKKNKLPAAMPESLKQKILEIEGEDFIWIWCTGDRSMDRYHIGDISYYPYPGISIKNYFPYRKGKPYLSPIVAVQVGNITNNIATILKCRAWAENIPSDSTTKMQIIFQT